MDTVKIMSISILTKIPPVTLLRPHPLPANPYPSLNPGKHAILLFQECYINGIMHYVPFWGRLF